MRNMHNKKCMKKCKGKVNFKNEGVINNIKQQGNRCERMGLRGRWGLDCSRKRHSTVVRRKGLESPPTE